MKNEIIKKANTGDNKLEFIIVDDIAKSLIYNFILINFENISIIKANFPIELENEKNKDKNKDKIENKITYEETNINKNDIEKQLKSIDGIIFIYKFQKNEYLFNSIDYIYNIDKKIKKERLLQKIIIGNKLDTLASINKNKIKKHFNKIKNIKFLESSSNEKNDIISALEELIKIQKLDNEYEKFINMNKINEKLIINTFAKSKLNLAKCPDCNELYDILVDNYSNSVIFSCKKCKLKEKQIDFFEYENYKNTTKCYECNKDININSSNNYCFMCKKNICNSCTKNHLQKEDKCDINIFQNNLIDLFCNIHNKICYNYCLECKTNICIECEIESHMNHEKKIFDDKKIIELISNNKKKLEFEKKKFKKVKEMIEDCLNELKKYFDNLIRYKEKEINIKEEIIKECEIFKYDNTLIENLQKLNFGININFIKEDKWEKKLNNILEYFNEPIKIKKTKLCQKDNFKGPFEYLKQINVNNNNNDIEINENITDLCPLFNYNGENYFAVSYDSGLLKIYNDDFENRIPKKIIKEFEKNKGINSLYKSNNVSIYLVGNSKIKKIRFSENLNEYKIINEIEIENQIFKNILELDSFDILIATNNLNQLIYINSKTGNIISNITKSINEKENEILYLDKISDNKIIILFQEINLININLKGNSMSITFEDFEDVGELNNNINNKTLNSIYNQNENSDIYWQILEFDMNDNNVEIKKNHLFDKNIKYLGKINDQLILLFNNNLNKIIIFDLISYYNILELPFNQNPILCFRLNRRNDLFDFLFICKERYLVQYVINLKIGFYYPIGKIKINEENKEDIQLVETNSNVTKGNKEEKTENFVKIILLEKNNFLFMTDEHNVYNLKHSQL